MPVEDTYGYSEGMRLNEHGEYKINESWPDLSGNKVVTLSTNFAVLNNYKGSTFAKNGGVAGPSPDEQVEEWVRATLEELIGGPSTLTT